MRVVAFLKVCDLAFVASCLLLRVVAVSSMTDLKCWQLELKVEIFPCKGKINSKESQSKIISLLPDVSNEREAKDKTLQKPRSTNWAKIKNYFGIWFEYPAGQNFSFQIWERNFIKYWKNYREATIRSNRQFFTLNLTANTNLRAPFLWCRK